MAMRPLKVVFHFGSPLLVDSERPVHLDALIASAVAAEAETMGNEDAWRAAEDLSEYLEKAVHENGWVWKASALQFEPHERCDGLFVPFNMVRRSDPARYYDDLDRGLWGSERKVNPATFKIDTASGQQRGYQWVAQARWIKSATAWAVGDIEALQDALTHIDHVGKMGRNGFGRVSSLNVAPADAGEADRWMLRTLPDGMPGMDGMQYEPVQACLRAPYWRKTNRVMARDPIV